MRETGFGHGMVVASIHCGYSSLPKTYTKPGQLNSNTRWESPDVPPIAEEPEALDDCWSRENHFFRWWRGIDKFFLPMCIRTGTN